jgi:tol-pal system protein YbgF
MRYNRSRLFDLILVGLVIFISPLGYAETLAVVVGNAHYVAPIPNVEFAPRDAAAMSDALSRVMGADGPHQILLKDASKGQMEAVFGSETNYQGLLWRRTNKKTNIVVYYSGHGAPRAKDGKPLLIPVDATTDTIDILGYGLDVLISNLSRLEAKSVTVYVDACFSGLSEGGTLVESASPIQIVPMFPTTTDPRIVVFSAAGPRELATWDRADGHGLFTSALLKAFSGAADSAHTGQITLGMLNSFISPFVTDQARLLLGREQHPVLSGDENRIVAERPAGGWPQSFAVPVSVSSPPAQLPTPSVAVPQALSLPNEQYDFAFGLLRKPDYEGASKAFQTFLAQHPQDPLAGNATYWLGQIPFAQGQYDRAAVIFLDAYQKYPKSAKAGESLLKVGLSMSNLGKQKEACAALHRFASEYPDAADNLRRQATAERQKLGC